MKLLITGGRIVDPASRRDERADLVIDAGRIVAIGAVPADFRADRTLDAAGCVVAPGLVDLAARLREPGHEHEGMLESELAAAAAGGVTSLVCPPDTDPVLDEPGLVEMLKFRARKTSRCRLFPLGALTRGLEGQALTEMAELTEAGCIGFSQAEIPIRDTQVLQRALQYAATFGYTVWLRPQDAWLGGGVAARGAVATRLGLSAVPVSAETIALHTVFELVRETGARVHLCRLSSAAGVALLRAAKAEGLPITADVSINSLHLTDADIGYFDPAMRLQPPLRQAHDRAALRRGLADGTIDALVSDHTPVGSRREDAAVRRSRARRHRGRTAARAGAGLGWRRRRRHGRPLRALAVVTSEPVRVLGSSLGAMAASAGRLVEGGVADICVFDPDARWTVEPARLASQGRHTPFTLGGRRGRTRRPRAVHAGGRQRGLSGVAGACRRDAALRLRFAPGSGPARWRDRRRQGLAAGSGACAAAVAPALGGHGGGRGSRCRRVAEEIVPDRLQIVVELVDQRNAVRDVEADDVGIGDAVQILHQRANAVAVGDDEQALPGWRWPAQGCRSSTACTRSTVSFRHSVSGTSPGASDA